MTRIDYGPDPSQWIAVGRPNGASRGLVVVIHGGFWKAAYGAEYATPLAVDLVEQGWTTAVVEYRRVGNGGGWPATADDVDAAINEVAGGHDTVVALGHSAGGQLAAWAAARTRFPRWEQGEAVTHVVTQAGVLDLGAAAEQDLGDGAVQAFLATDDETVADQADPMRQLPLDVPLWALHARDDDVVPFELSGDYVERASTAGARAELIEVSGGHFDLVETDSRAWARVVEVLEEIG